MATSEAGTKGTGRRVAARLLGVCAVLQCVSFIAATHAAAGAASLNSPIKFGPSSIDGGGWENVVAISPIVDPVTGVPPVLAGGDVSGVHRSTDWGATWTPANSGIEVQQFVDLAISSLAFSPSGTAYAAVGTTSAHSGGLYVSADQGRTWSFGPNGCSTAVDGTTPHFYGSSRVSGNDNRSTGNLFAFGATKTMHLPLLFAAAFGQGLMRSADGGCTWEAVPLLTGQAHVQQPVVTSIDTHETTDPSSGLVDQQVFVATEFYGVFEVDNANADTIAEVPAPRPLPASFATAKALDVVGDTVFIAAATNGVFRYPLPLGPMQPIYPDPSGTSSPANANANWVSIAGYVDTRGATPITRLYAGTRASTLSLQLWDSASQHWSSVIDSNRANVFAGLGGPMAPAPRRTWWSCGSMPSEPPDTALCTGDGGWGPGGAQFSANHIALDRSSDGGPPQHIFVSAAIGIWGTAASWSPAPHDPTRWYPLVRGLNSDVASLVVGGSSCSFAAVSDQMLFSSNDGFATDVSHVSPWSDWGTRGTAVSVDGSSVAVGAGDNTGGVKGGAASDKGGGVNSGNVQIATFDQQTCRPTSAWSQPGTPLNLTTQTKTNASKRPMASAHHGTRLLETTNCLGAQSNTKCGAVWMYDAAASVAGWVDISPQTPLPNRTSTIVAPVDLASPSGSPFAYLYDTTSGLWRWDSTATTPADGWTNIWHHGMTPSTYLQSNEGSIAVKHDSSGDTVFISVGSAGNETIGFTRGGVYRVTNADGGSPTTAPIPGAPVAPGPLTLRPDGALLYVTTYQVCTDINRPGTCSAPNLVTYAPGTGSSGLWSTDPGGPPALGNDTTYASVAFRPTSISVSPDGRVYVSLANDGLLVGS